MARLKVTEDLVEFDVPTAGKTCKTWYKIVGDLSYGITPIIVIHGGPGLTHDYVLPMMDLQHMFQIPVIFYDQLGNGRSTHLPEKAGDESFWTEALFHAELSNLISKLSLDSYDILGHSWGGMIGSTFAASQPKGLRKLVISNSPATIKSYDDAFSKYRKQLPQDVQDTMQHHEEAGTTKSPEYEKAMAVFNERHFCKIHPLPDEYRKSFDWLAKDTTVVLTMQGPSDWIVTGSMAVWNAVPVVKNIAVLTLVINGTNEGSTDEAVAPFVEGIPCVKWVKLHNSTHMPHWEEREEYMKLVGEWLGYKLKSEYVKVSQKTSVMSP